MVLDMHPVFSYPRRSLVAPPFSSMVRHGSASAVRLV
jgi:hypothetical protein